MENLNIEALHELNESFLKEFPLDTLSEMTLNKYTNLNKSDSFCYWLERRTQMLGGIGGGSSFKFGIYRCKNKPKEGKIRYKYDGKFAWLEQLGNTAEEAFVIVKESVVKAAKYGSKGDLDAIESIAGDVIGSHVKWKIAFLYSTESIIPYYGHERLKVIAEKMGMANANAAKISDIQKFLLNKRGEKDLHEFGKYLDELYKNGEKDLDSPKLKINYWLAGYSFGGDNSQLERFIRDRIWEGGYKDIENRNPNLLKDAKAISKGDVIILKSSSVKGANRNLPFLRIKAIGVVTNDIIIYDEGDETKFRCSVDYINTDEKDFDGKVYGAYRRTLHRADSRVQDIIDYVNKIINPMPQPPKYKEYIEFLVEAHNLVLTGAPGTGKTYMAKEIAKEMDAEIEFVQFHPSYDYTDFVEGLRPIEKGDGQMGFERKDGVFKEFCARAITDKSTQAGNIMADSLAPKGISRAEFWSIYNSIVADIQSGRLTSYPTPYKSQSLSVKNGRIVFRADSNNPRTEKESNLKLLYDYFVSLNKYDLSGLDKDDYWNLITTLTNGATKTIDYIEYNWILQEMLNRAKQISVKKDQVIVTHPDILDSAVLQSKHNNKKRLRPFVFIIDEINRGEASKIFGELFFAIDPGYRGKTDILVQTQYQNLVPETDVFAKGFYVPENVYILATMNDIDRSVESMDFAMRRRFTWHEITPDDTEYMLDDLPRADEAKETMHRLNAAIAETDGLGAAYMIGPAYFLKLKDNGGDFEKLWNMNIEPLLKEYLRGFRKTAEILDKFRKAYFNENSETPADASDLLE